MNNRLLNRVIIILSIIIVLALAYIFLFSNNSRIESIKLNDKNITLFIGESKNLSVNILPEDVSNDEIIWESGDASIASVIDGKVTGISTGNTVITVKSKDGKVSDTCIVKVIKNEIEQIELSEVEFELIVGNEKELEVTITPSKLQNESVTWESSDESIATVENGKVTGIMNGEVTIKAIVGNKEATCNVKIITLVESIKFAKDSISVEEGSSVILNPIFTPETASNKKVTWTTSDASIASIDDGKVNGIKVGKVKITATTVEGEKIATCEVKVTEKPKYTIKYEDVNKKVTRKKGEALGTLPIANKKGYRFLGWYTAKSGGTKVTASTIVTGKMTLYAHWESVYVITSDSSKTSGFSVKASYDSTTLKYKILAAKNGYYTIIWVNNANMQVNTALANYPKFGHQDAGGMLNDEIKRRGYQKKGMVAINGSFSYGNAPGIPIIMSHGKVEKNRSNDSLPNYHTVGINKDGELVCYLRNSVTVSKLTNAGVRNTFAGNYCRSDNTNGGGTDTTWKTVLCQVDEKNFALLTGSGRTTLNAEKELQQTFGCDTVVNLDGGGSTRLYYKYNNMSSVRNMYRSERDPNRPIVDTLYFVEQ